MHDLLLWGFVGVWHAYFLGYTAFFWRIRPSITFLRPSLRVLRSSIPDLRQSIPPYLRQSIPVFRHPFPHFFAIHSFAFFSHPFLFFANLISHYLRPSIPNKNGKYHAEGKLVIASKHHLHSHMEITHADSCLLCKSHLKYKHALALPEIPSLQLCLTCQVMSL